MTMTAGSDLSFESVEATLRYDFSPGVSPPVLVMHGISGSRGMLPAYVPEMRKRYAYDARGHGLSSRTPGGYRITDYGRDAIRFLESVVREPAILLGHSLGALVSIYVAAKRPDLVTGIILAEPPIYAWESGLRDQEVLLRGFHVNAGREIAELTAEGIPPLRALDLSRADPEAVAMMVDGRAYVGWSVEALLQEIDCPVVFQYGDENSGSHVYEGEPERAMSFVGQSRLVHIPGSGHGAWFLKPDEFRSELNRAIEWILQSSAK